MESLGFEQKTHKILAPMTNQSCDTCVLRRGLGSWFDGFFRLARWSSIVRVTGSVRPSPKRQDFLKWPTSSENRGQEERTLHELFAETPPIEEEGQVRCLV